jgi:hypothetical protein
MFPDRSLLTAAKPTPPITSAFHPASVSKSPCRIRVTRTKQRNQGTSGLEEFHSRDSVAIGGINWHLLEGSLDGAEPGARGVDFVCARHSENANMEQWEQLQCRKEEATKGQDQPTSRRGIMSTVVPSAHRREPRKPIRERGTLKRCKSCKHAEARLLCLQVTSLVS